MEPSVCFWYATINNIVKAPIEYLKKPNRIPDTRIGSIPDKNLEITKFTPQRRMIIANIKYGLLDDIDPADVASYLELVVVTNYYL